MSIKATVQASVSGFIVPKELKARVTGLRIISAGTAAAVALKDAINHNFARVGGTGVANQIFTVPAVDVKFHQGIELVITPNDGTCAADIDLEILD